MKQPKHTPGPWKLTTIQGKKYSEQIHNKDMTFICDFNCNPMHPMTKEERANAHLIAAAPEMLETLEYILQNWSPKRENQSLKEWQDEIGDIALLIAKAKGESE